MDAAFKTFHDLQVMDAAAASSAAVVSQLAGAALVHDPAAATSLDKHLEDLPELQAAAKADLEAAGPFQASHA